MTEIATSGATGAVTGGLKTLLRLEGLALFAAMTLLYAVWGGSWWVYAILFLAPDLSFAGYLAPAALMATGFTLAVPPMLSIAMIWLAHIGFDRALGYGLKYSAGFGFTH